MSISVIHGDCLDILPTLAPDSIQCCVTSPPYFGLRQYGGGSAEIGTEATPDSYVAALVAVFRGVRNALRSDGTLWLNLGDSMKDKNLLGIPWRVAFALQVDGWYLRSAIVWHKPNPMPEAVKDRPTSSYEMVFLFAKSGRYFYDAPAIQEDADVSRAGKVNTNFSNGNAGITLRKDVGRSFVRPEYRNARNVWTIPPSASGIEHFAMMPAALAERCIKAGSAAGDTILDPFGGAGTTAMAADRLGRNAVIIELNAANVDLARGRIRDDAGMFAVVA